MARLAELYGWHAVLTPELLVVAAGIALFYAKAGNVQPNQTGVFVSLRWTRQTAFYTGVVFPVHMLLLASAWFMWESLFHPELIRQQREKFRTQLMVLGSIILFPVCMVMTGSDYMAFAYSHNLVTALCVSPEAERLSIAYGIGSTSAFGGMLLMAAQQLSLALTNRPVKIQH